MLSNAVLSGPQAICSVLGALVAGLPQTFKELAVNLNKRNVSPLPFAHL